MEVNCSLLLLWIVGIIACGLLDNRKQEACESSKIHNLLYDESVKLADKSTHWLTLLIVVQFSSQRKFELGKEMSQHPQGRHGVDGCLL